MRSFYNDDHNTLSEESYWVCIGEVEDVIITYRFSYVIDYL